MSMEENDIAAVARAREGDGEAFRLLVERHSRNIFRLVYRMTGSEQDSEDLVQETFLRAFRNLSRFEQRASFGTWLHRIAVNCAMDWIRRRRVHEELDDQQADPAAEGARPDGQASNGDGVIYQLEIQQRVQAALGDLSPLERSAFVLRHYEGMSIEEIGSVLGVRSNAAKHSIFRAVRKMRRALEPIVS
jgi:RNA polymerase sigma-70 factor, ECF subfamily